MGLQGSPVACANCGADLTPRHGRIVVTMETGGEFPAGNGRVFKIPHGEVKLCAGCAAAGVRGEKLGLSDGPVERIASRQ